LERSAIRTLDQCIANRSVELHAIHEQPMRKRLGILDPLKDLVDFANQLVTLSRIHSIGLCLAGDHFDRTLAQRRFHRPEFEYAFETWQKDTEHERGTAADDTHRRNRG
jgi:hypothetical protein